MVRGAPRRKVEGLVGVTRSPPTVWPPRTSQAMGANLGCRALTWHRPQARPRRVMARTQAGNADLHAKNGKQPRPRSSPCDPEAGHASCGKPARINKSGRQAAAPHYGKPKKLQPTGIDLNREGSRRQGRPRPTTAGTHWKLPQSEIKPVLWDHAGAGGQNGAALPGVGPH